MAVALAHAIEFSHFHRVCLATRGHSRPRMHGALRQAMTRARPPVSVRWACAALPSELVFFAHNNFDMAFCMHRLAQAWPRSCVQPLRRISCAARKRTCSLPRLGEP